jgi:glycosyltransferase involved in cell wall biosynthesis
MGGPGGGAAVAAWALEALRTKYDVTVLTWAPVDCAKVNRVFGTDLEENGVCWETIQVPLRRLIDATPLPLALLSIHLLIRRAKALHRTRRFDVIFGTINEIELGIRAIQYIHYPWIMFPRPDVDYRWYHLNRLIRVYRWLCTEISGHGQRPLSDNVTLVNSNWTGAVFERCYGVPGRTLYPPVPGGFPDIPFEAREDGFVCLGRISAEKELEKLIEILAGVRARGHKIRFHIVGHIDNPAYARRIYRTAEPHSTWVSFHHDLPRDALVALVARNRYGIHGMVGEHFGIAPAELQRAGCITLVPDEGGPVEIVGGDERVIYHSVDDAVEKIDNMLRDPGLRADLLRDVAVRAKIFSEQRFMTELLEIVDNFDASSEPLKIHDLPGLG